MERPLYRVVIDTIVDRIASGELPPGAMLPSETQLGADLGVSQGTARKALIELENRQLVQRIQGRGTFVTVRTPETSLFNFFRLRNPDGTQVRPELVEEHVARRPAAPEEAEALFDSPDEVVEVERVRTLGGRRVAHEVSVVPARMFPGLFERAPLPNTLYVLYQQAYHIIITRAEESLRATLADETIAKALDIAPGTPVLRVERQAIDVLDRCVELRRSHCVTEDQVYAVSLS